MLHLLSNRRRKGLLERREDALVGGIDFGGFEGLFGAAISEGQAMESGSFWDAKKTAVAAFTTPATHPMKSATCGVEVGSGYSCRAARQWFGRFS